MRQISYVLTLMTTSVLLTAWTMAATPGNSVKRFEQSQLASVSVVSDRPQAGSNTHLFTITMPEGSGKRFTKLSFSFTKQNRERTVAPMRFDLANTRAFIGSSEGRRAIDIKDMWIDETGILWVQFNAPVPPQTKITLALKLRPLSSAATYDYGIAAYPESNAAAIFVGDGTLTIKQ